VVAGTTLSRSRPVVLTLGTRRCHSSRSASWPPFVAGGKVDESVATDVCEAQWARGADALRGGLPASRQPER
jgi:hypothetical protein